MNNFIARQPVFDRRRRVFGYELLFRQNGDNYFAGVDDDTATSDVIYNSFMVFGLDNITDDTRAFINCSKRLIESDFLSVLPKEKIILEILERGPTTPATLEACKRLKDLGYKLALDDFVPSAETLPLLEYADIVKIEYPALGLAEQAACIRRFKNRVKFLAEKVETYEDFKTAHKIGYDFFQGYFFSGPSMLKSEDIGSLNVNLLRIMEELNRPEPSYPVIADIIAADLGLNYKLLRLVNSAYIGPRHKINSILQALSYLGTRELCQWMSMMLLRDLEDDENAELIKQSLIRGKLMSDIAQGSACSKLNCEYFFTGIFSMIDVILNRSIDEILAGLPLPEKVKHALRGGNNELRRLLDFIISFENAQWQELSRLNVPEDCTADRFMSLYIDALKWARQVTQI
jgi:c-di-GMP-related signal transduction protein